MVKNIEYNIEEILSETADFDYIRACVADLKSLIQWFGPLTEVIDIDDKQFESSDPTRTYDEVRGWICDELENYDRLKIWTEWDNGEGCYLTQGYSYDHDEIVSWYIAKKPYEEISGFPTLLTTVYLIDLFDPDTEEHLGSSAIDLFKLTNVDELSDHTILQSMDFIEKFHSVS